MGMGWGPKIRVGNFVVGGGGGSGERSVTFV